MPLNQKLWHQRNLEYRRKHLAARQALSTPAQDIKVETLPGTEPKGIKRKEATNGVKTPVHTQDASAGEVQGEQDTV